MRQFSNRYSVHSQMGLNTNFLFTLFLFRRFPGLKDEGYELSRIAECPILQIGAAQE